MSVTVADPALVAMQLEEILSDPAFARAPRMTKLLTYLVEEELAGRGDKLRGYKVGVEALDKGSDFDPSVDAGVRVEIGRLRRMLARYFAENELARVNIEIPKGTYRPKFIAPEPETRSPRIHFAAPSAGPAVAVLSFEYNTENKEIDKLATGLRFEILGELCRYREFHFVDASGISGEDEDVHKRCRDALECEYMLKTQLLDLDAGARLFFSITDLQINRVIWTEKQDVDLKHDVLHTAQLLAGEIARNLMKPAGVLPIAAAKKQPAELSDEMTASDCILRWHLYRLRERTAENHRALKSLVRRLLKNDPWFAYGYLIYAMLRIDEVVYRLNPPNDGGNPLERAEYLIQQSISVDPENAFAHYVKAQCHYFQGDLVRFRESLDNALKLNPRNPDILHQAGAFLCFSGDWELGKRYLDLAEMRYHPGVGYRLAHLVYEYYINDDPTVAHRLLQTAYLPADLSAGLLVACLVETRAGNLESAGEFLRRAYRVEKHLNRDLESLVSLWFADPNLKAKAMRDLKSVEATSGVLIRLG